MSANHVKRAILGAIDGLRYTQSLTILIITSNEAETNDVITMAIEIGGQMVVTVVMQVLTVDIDADPGTLQHGSDISQPLRKPVNIGTIVVDNQQDTHQLFLCL